MKKPKKNHRKRIVLRSSALLVFGLMLMLEGEQMLEQSGALPQPPAENSADAPSADDWNLILVNGSHAIPENFTVELAEVQKGYSVDARIAADLKAMLQAARDAGLKPILRSAYRSHSTQTYLYDRKVKQYIDKGYSKKDAAAAAARWVAPPGTSEHQLGLAVDIVGQSYQKLDEKQENTPEQKWLMEHCWEYGFILRYPSDKSELTGIAYEPWHYRYVGREIAQDVTEQGVCLEEYLENLK